MKAKINALDAYSLIYQHKLYPNKLKEVLMGELKVNKILCISDTAEAFFLKPNQSAKSLARTLEIAGLGPELSVIQSDYIPHTPAHHNPEEKYKSESKILFGNHLPQNKDETRREYIKLDATQLDQDLVGTTDVQVILGRACLCACSYSSNGCLCGGIAGSQEAQAQYIESFVKLEPKIIVLSASPATFDPANDDNIAPEQWAADQARYKETQQNLTAVCQQLNHKAEQSGDPYRYELIPTHEKLGYIFTGETMENGYMLVAYDSSRVDFDNSVESLQAQRVGKYSLALIVRPEVEKNLVPPALDPEAILAAQQTVERSQFAPDIAVLTNQNQEDVTKEGIPSPLTINRGL